MSTHRDKIWVDHIRESLAFGQGYRYHLRYSLTIGISGNLVGPTRTGEGGFISVVGGNEAILKQKPNTAPMLGLLYPCAVLGSTKNHGHSKVACMAGANGRDALILRFQQLGHPHDILGTASRIDSSIIRRPSSLYEILVQALDFLMVNSHHRKDCAFSVAQNNTPSPRAVVNDVGG